MGIDDGFCQHAAVKGMALAYHPAFNHDDGRVPAALEQRLPPFAQPFADIERHRNAGKLGFERVGDDIEGQRTLAAGDIDFEWTPRAGPTI